MRAIVLVAMWMGLVWPAAAQIRVSGRVTDDTNAPVGNATVVVRPKTAEVPRQRVLTGPTGAFTIDLAVPGDYMVTVERTGYFQLADRAVSIDAGSTDLHLVLTPLREVSSSVDVASGSTAVALDQSTSEEKLTGAEILDIPIASTNNLRNSMRVLPSVVQDGTGGIHVNGGAEEQVQYLLNGFNIGDPLTGKFVTRISVEAVQTMQVLAGPYSAEYGKGSAGVMSVYTKSGDDKFRYSATNFVPGVEFRKGAHVGGWTPRFNFSGPIRKGRAWFSDSLSLQYDQTVIRELPRGADTSPSWRYSNFLHTQVNLTPSNILYIGFLANYWHVRRSGLTALDPAETTLNRRSTQWFGSIKDQIYFGRGALVEFGFASNRASRRDSPQGDGLYIMTPVGRQGNYFVDSARSGARDQVLANGFLPSFTRMGSHHIKTGLDLNRVAYWQNVHRTGYEWYNQSLTPVRQVLFEGNGRLGLSNFETSAYLVDSWRVRPNLLAEIGVRGDWDRILRNWVASPRVGLAWAPPHFENTKISGGYAITYDSANLQLFARGDDQYSITTYFPPYGTPDNPIITMYRVPGEHFATPRYRTWSAALDQRIGSNVFVRVQGLRRRGDRGLTYFNTPDRNGVYHYELGNTRREAYDKVEITVRQNLRKQYEWLASYTRSRALSNAVIDLASDDPAVAASNVGRLPWDAPHRLLNWAYLPTFWKNWAVAYLLEYHSGFPFSAQNDIGNIVGGVNARRYPDFFELNLHIERRFTFRGQVWAGRAGFNNITDHHNPNVVINNIDSSQFLHFFGGQSRSLNFRIRWLGKL